MAEANPVTTIYFVRHAALTCATRPTTRPLSAKGLQDRELVAAYLAGRASMRSTRAPTAGRSTPCAPWPTRSG